MGHGRAPGVQDTGDTELCTDVLGVSGDGEYGLSRCLEQQVVDHGLVVTGDIGDLSRHGEYHMVVGHGQQFGLTGFQPIACRVALTLGTVPVAA